MCLTGCGYITYGNLDEGDESVSMTKGLPYHVIFSVQVANNLKLSHDELIPFMSALLK